MFTPQLPFHTIPHSTIKLHYCNIKPHITRNYVYTCISIAYSSPPQSEGEKTSILIYFHHSILSIEHVLISIWTETRVTPTLYSITHNLVITVLISSRFALSKLRHETSRHDTWNRIIQRIRIIFCLNRDTTNTRITHNI